ncbi:MAG: hypothetical protein R8G34_17790 [Paracoccaceae bacterium]|nr:hypothetical protein [Paracoccaceae bacterium]
MSGETYKILAGMLALEEFTGAQLAKATGVNPHTVNSWLRRSSNKGRYVVSLGTNSPSRGRPRKIWRLRDEEADAIRQELGALAGLPQTERELSDAESARRAFEDPDIRRDIHYHLSQAERAEFKEERDHALKKAFEWYDFETQRLKEWTDSGYVPPEAVAEEMARLNRQIAGMKISVEKLGSIAMRGVDGFADWFEEAIEHWFSDEAARQKAFHPLVPTQSENDNPREDLHDTLWIILETAEECSIIRQDYLICGLLMAMARIENANAYLVIADVFCKLGYDTVGRALHARLNAAHGNERTQRFMHQALIGLAEDPAMLQDSIIGNWVDSLMSHRLYNPFLCLSLLQCLERRDQVDLMRLAREKRYELRQLRQIIEGNSDAWDQINRGISRDQGEFTLQIDRMLSLGNALQETGMSEFAAAFEQPKSNALADRFKAFFAPGHTDHVLA